MAQSTRRAVIAWLLGVIAVFGAARAVALPEHCEPAKESERVAAATAAVHWLVGNQRDDGRFLYRYDVVRGREISGYNWIRHAGTMVALAQAANAGIDIGDSFDQAFDAIRGRVVEDVTSGRSAVEDAGSVTTGGSALLLLALLERRVGGDRTHDTMIQALAAFVESSVVPSSFGDGSLAVREVADTSMRFDPGSTGPFTTGEVAYALAAYATRFPSPQLEETVHGVLGYLVHHKAVIEGYVPDMADHWAAYAMSEMTRWSDGGSFTDDEIAWARKQMGLVSVMVRYESQRSNRGVDRWLRGRTSVGSAVGTHGEMLSGWLTLADAVPELAEQTGGLADRLRCNMATLVDRQISSAESARFPDPDRARGAWTWFGVTQVDDQQHSLSALVRGGNVLDSGIVERQVALPSSWLLVLMAMVVVLNPWRVARAAKRAPRPRLHSRARVFVVYLLAVIAGSTVLDWLDTSVPTAVVAAGVVMVLGSLATLPRTRVDPTSTMAALRAEAVVLAVACGAGGRGWAAVGGVLVSLMIASRATRRTPEHALVWWSRTSATAAAVAGVMLIVSGVYAV